MPSVWVADSRSNRSCSMISKMSPTKARPGQLRFEYQNTKYAQQFTDDIARLRSAEAAAVGDRTDLSEIAARMLYKVMAYKDEYEVARLALK